MKRITIAALVLLCAFVSLGAGVRFHGQPASALSSSRNIINLNFTYDFSYPFINLIHTGGPSINPISGYDVSASTWNQLIDSNGWPNNSAASGKAFGGATRLPASSDFAGPYVVTWEGTGTFYFQGIDGVGTTCSETNNTGTTYTRVSNCQWSNVAGQNAYIRFNLTGTAMPRESRFFQFSATGGADGFAKNLKIYRLEDEADLQAGKIFRAGFKQPIVDHNPFAVRFLNWHGNQTSQNIRWENRTLPTNAGWQNRANWVSSPPYGSTSGTNQYTLSAVSSGSNQTPASMKHGEPVTARFSNACVRRQGATVTAIQNQNVPQVTTSSDIDFNVGDTIVIHQEGGDAVSGMMTKLNYYPVTIAAKTDARHFTINADTTSWGALDSAPSPGGSVRVDAYISLQVGSGSDRTSYPITGVDGQSPLGRYGGWCPTTNNVYRTVVFNKNVSAKTDGSGNYVMGVWVMDTADNSGFNGDTPVEILTALINELNEMSVAQGISNPIHMYINMPAMGMVSFDPDYSLASNYPVQMTSTILNGANGYSGLTSRAKLLVEFTNETWNTAFKTPFFLAWEAFLRWPTSPYSFNLVDMTVLRHAASVRDIRANVSGITNRVYFVMGGKGPDDFTNCAACINYNRTYGRASAGGGYWYMTDTTVGASAWGAPHNYWDAINGAPYFDLVGANRTYLTNTGTSSMTDEVARYFGLDNSGNGGGNYSGAANTTQAIANAISQITCDPTCVPSAGGFSISTLKANRAAVAAGIPAGKYSIEYEGGENWPFYEGASYFEVRTLSANDAAFLFAVISSTQWRDAQIGYFAWAAAQSKMGPSALYTYTGGQQWSYTPDLDTYSGGVEGAALAANPLWVGAGSRNRALPY